MSVEVEKHTPGPWELRGPMRVYGNLQHDQNGTADLVASTVMHADALLIAAAPDMAVEGSFLLDRLDDFERSLTEDDATREYAGHVAPAAARFRAAIAKALPSTPPEDEEGKSHE